ncbi:hypothetical protein QFZ71_001617 [Streptomyces sp. V2I9]|nr:hypothetical protein [Streptomyces sp. V2I9]
MSREKGWARNAAAFRAHPFPVRAGYALLAAHSAQVPKISTVCATFT